MRRAPAPVRDRPDSRSRRGEDPLDPQGGKHSPQPTVGGAAVRYHWRSATMKLLRLAVIAASACVATAPAKAYAHPVPFSYIDARLQPGTIDISVVVHIFDVAHDLGITASEQLLDPGQVRARTEQIT